MPWVMLIAGDYVDGALRPFHEVQYLKSYDLEYAEGRGLVEMTVDVAKAVQFASRDEVVAAWQSVSKTRALRLDGKLNKPLSHFSIVPMRWQGLEGN